MSWNDELYKVYEYNCGREFVENETVMLPVAHTTANAQIELTISEHGEFKSARSLNKSEAETIIPATEKSAGRTGIEPMPYADNLVYLAGDYGEFTECKRSDNSAIFDSYMNQLNSWCKSKYSHKAVRALFKYLEKKCLMSDLIKAGVLQTDEQTGKLNPKIKIAGIEQEKAFVRIIVNYDDGINKTWLDKSLYDSFISFNNGFMGEKQLCYATGNLAAPTYKHPSKILRNKVHAKLISTDDKTGFKYRGRFNNREEAISIGYDYSQRIHNALRWLIRTQGETLDSLTIIAWASDMQKIPNIENKCYDDNDDDLVFENEIPTTILKYTNLLRRKIMGYEEALKPNTKIMIMGLDSATTGRVNLSLYSELEGSKFLENVERWHLQTSWLRFSSRNKKNFINSFSLYEIVKCAFGTEQGEFINCSTELKKDNILRLVSCVTDGKPIPSDIVNSLYFKASNPLSYDKVYNHRMVLETACGMIRKNRIDKQKGDISMAYDPNLTDRSYLYGCLLAIADKAESEAYDQNERNERVTNARRYWNAFSQRPYQTWRIIEERLRPYFDKLGRAQVKYNKWINEITSKITADDFSNNTRLDPLYLLGYHQFTDFMYNNPQNKEEN